MRVADTSALYAAFVKEDAHHRQARAAFERADPILLPHEILVETIGLIEYRWGFDPAVAVAEVIAATPHIRLVAGTKDLMDQAIDLHRAAAGALSLADAVVAAWCRREAAEALAFDKDLLRYARSA